MPPPLPAGASPFDALRRENIPPDVLKYVADGDPAKAPKDLVAVFGERAGLGYCRAYVSPDGRRLFISTQRSGSGVNSGGVLLAYDTASGKEIPELRRENLRTLGAALSRDGRRLAVMGSGQVTLLDAATGKELTSFPTIGTPGDLVINSDATRVAATQSEGQAMRRWVNVWNTATGQLLYTRETGDSWFSNLSFSPDGQRLATYRRDGTVTLWDTASGKELLRFATFDTGQYLAFSPDGARLTTFNKQGTQVRDAQTGAVLTTVAGSCTGNSFSPDGKWLASNGNAKDLVVVWNASTGKPRQQWLVPGANDARVFFAPDGRHLLLASASKESTVYVLRLAALAGQ